MAEPTIDSTLICVICNKEYDVDIELDDRQCFACPECRGDIVG